MSGGGGSSSDGGGGNDMQVSGAEAAYSQEKGISTAADTKISNTSFSRRDEAKDNRIDFATDDGNLNIVNIGYGENQVDPGFAKARLGADTSTQAIAVGGMEGGRVDSYTAEEIEKGVTSDGKVINEVNYVNKDITRPGIRDGQSALSYDIEKGFIQKKMGKDGVVKDKEGNTVYKQGDNIRNPYTGDIVYDKNLKQHIIENFTNSTNLQKATSIGSLVGVLPEATGAALSLIQIANRQAKEYAMKKSSWMGSNINEPSWKVGLLEYEKSGGNSGGGSEPPSELSQGLVGGDRILRIANGEEPGYRAQDAQPFGLSKEEAYRQGKITRDQFDADPVLDRTILQGPIELNRTDEQNEMNDMSSIAPYLVRPGINPPPGSPAADWFAIASKNNQFAFQAKYNSAKKRQAKILNNKSNVGLLAVNRTPYYNFLYENKLDKGIL
tara:strand:- start:1190 stop:2509 length:1320 start_codon:yes stop_codon:yes gene_type:complete